MFREKIKVLDCTIRDGGLMNNHLFEDDLVRATYRALSRSGIDYMEIGYKNSKSIFSSKEFGKWKFCDDDDIKRVIDGVESDMKISVMVDVGRVEMEDVKPKKESPVDMIRVASYVKEIDKAIHLANHFADKGYETAINIMAISRALDNELNEALEQLEKESRAGVIYIVDSFGALYQETTEFLVKKAGGIIKSKEIGIHAHNNQQLAFSNTIEAIIHNANYVDATVYGLGRGAGNCPLELIMGFLKNPKFDIRPIFELISDYYIPLGKKIEWGYSIPYAITGMLDEHPKPAIEYHKGPKQQNFRDFYDSIKGKDLD
jgi:4-hydroxy 2-oxovalerate aldolase